MLFTVINAGAAAAAAAAAAKRAREEEEEMTQYTDQELQTDWEFKIIRSNTKSFDKPDVFRRMLVEESEFGWQLVEKFDGSRVRLKRQRQATPADAYGRDPYRTTYGVTEGAMVGFILLAIGAVFSVLMLVIVLLTKK